MSSTTWTWRGRWTGMASADLPTPWLRLDPAARVAEVRLGAREDLVPAASHTVLYPLAHTTMLEELRVAVEPPLPDLEAAYRGVPGAQHRFDALFGHALSAVALMSDPGLLLPGLWWPEGGLRDRFVAILATVGDLRRALTVFATELTDELANIEIYCEPDHVEAALRILAHETVHGAQHPEGSGVLPVRHPPRPASLTCAPVRLRGVS